MDAEFKVTVKKCRGCGEVYPLSSDFFHKKVENRDGFNNFCRECVNAKTREFDEARRTVYQVDPPVWVDEGVCGVCGKPLSQKERSGGFLCGAHKPRLSSMDDSTCWHCPWIAICRKRMRVFGGWILCERPDSYDVLRVSAGREDG